ncbi:signal peptidase I [Arthrobacter stackebrandtii]|nr:signal peptidase I [Arthrobacter stackebrandtii]
MTTPATEPVTRRQLNRGQGKRRKRRHSRVWNLIGQVLSWFVLIAVLAVAAVMIVVPKAAGATAYTVLTSSMEPGLPPGSLAVVRPVDPAEVRTGDVITFQLKSGEPAVVTHRVVGVGSTLDGELRLTTRGDANGSDDDPIRAEQIRGRLWYQMPWLGYVNSMFSGRERQAVTIIAVTGLLAYSAFMFVGAYRDARAAKRRWT